MRVLVFRTIVLLLYVSHLTAAERKVTPREAIATRWREGVDYSVLNSPAEEGLKVEKPTVAEVFWYHCPHCNDFEPHWEEWVRSKQGCITTLQLPVVWGAQLRPEARLFYALIAVGRGDLQNSVFAAIHRDHLQLTDPYDPKHTYRLLLEFAGDHGISADRFAQAYNSAAVTHSVEAAERITLAYRVADVPAIVVNDRYLTDIARAGGTDRLLGLIDYLVKKDAKQNAQCSP